MRQFILLILGFGLITVVGCSGSGGSGDGGDNDNPDPGLPTTGVPDLDSFSISVTEDAIEGFNHDGATTTFTVRLADRLNQNTVPDGTPVFFTTEEGGSVGESCLLVSGSCSVTFTSHGQRPADGLVTVLAWVTGNESFQDLDFDGLYSSGDLFDDGTPGLEDLSEPFRDDDFDGSKGAAEEFIDFDDDNVFDPADGLYNGLFCAHPTDCSPTQFLYIWRDTEIVLSTSSANITLNPDPVVVGPLDITVTDLNGNPMADGTEISIETDNGELSSSSFIVGTDFGTVATIQVGTDDTSDTASFTVRVVSPLTSATTPYTTTFTD